MKKKVIMSESDEESSDGESSIDEISDEEDEEKFTENQLRYLKSYCADKASATLCDDEARRFVRSFPHDAQAWRSLVKPMVMAALKEAFPSHPKRVEAKWGALAKIWKEQTKRRGNLAKFHGGSKYITFGIGSSGPHGSDRGYLSCDEDLKYMRAYASKHNFYLGSVNEEGTSPCIEAIKTRIKYACISAWECEANLVLYYTGHGDEDGDWWFYDGNLSFSDLSKIVKSAEISYGAPIPNDCSIHVVSDCCNSGCWTELAANETKIQVISSTKRDKNCGSGFARVFFKGPLRMRWKDIFLLTGPHLQHYIQEHKKGSIPTDKVLDLKRQLLAIEKEKEKKIIKKVMKPGPWSASGGLSEDEVVHTDWFVNTKRRRKHLPGQYS